VRAFKFSQLNENWYVCKNFKSSHFGWQKHKHFFKNTIEAF
jgi:hypothetical protein